MDNETDKLLKQTIEIRHNGETYEFRIPSFMDEIKLGLQARRIRRQLDPEGDGSADGLDFATSMLVRSAAVFELLLQSATAKWPYSTGEHGEPVVDITKWPDDKMEEATAIGLAFETDLTRFRQNRAPDRGTAGAEAMAGEQAP